MPTNIEICYVQRAGRDELGFLGYLLGNFERYHWYTVKISSPSGERTIAQTNEFKYRPERGKTEDYENAVRLDQAYKVMIQGLLNNGWEVMTTDERGEILSLKRQIGAPTAASSISPTELLKQLASLRDAGILTEEEFQTKKAEILKRM